MVEKVKMTKQDSERTKQYSNKHPKGKTVTETIESTDLNVPGGKILKGVTSAITGTLDKVLKLGNVEIRSNKDGFFKPKKINGTNKD